MAHQIQLRGPWGIEWLTPPPESFPASPARLSDGMRLKLPVDWQSVFGAVPGRVRFSRVFHCPTNLDAEEKVHLVFGGVGGAATVSLNEQPLGGVICNQQPIRFDITSHLLPTNRVWVDVSYLPSEHGAIGGLWAPVWLEIATAESS